MTPHCIPIKQKENINTAIMENNNPLNLLDLNIHCGMFHNKYWMISFWILGLEEFIVNYLHKCLLYIILLIMRSFLESIKVFYADYLFNPLESFKVYS